MAIMRNATLNLLGSVVPLGVSLVTVPIYLKVIGYERYGVLSIVWVLLGYFGLFDLGLGRATAQRISSLRHATAAERSGTFWTAISLNLTLGLLGALLIWPTAHYLLGYVMEVDAAMRPEMLSALPWLALTLPMAMLVSVLSGALQGQERFLALNAISVTGTIVFQLAPLFAALYWGPNLAVLLPAALVARLLTVVLLFQVATRHLSHAGSIRVSKAEAGQLLKFGGWVTVTWIIGPLMTTLDRFLIGAVSGATAVTNYTVPYQLGDRFNVLSGALSSALFPRFGHAGDDERQQMALRALAALLTLLTPAMAIGIILIQPFLAWWISPNMAAAAGGVAKVLFIGFWLNGLAMVPFVLLQGAGRPDVVAKCHLVEFPPYAAVLYLGLEYYGIMGAAIAFTLRILLDFILLSAFARVLPQLLKIMVLPAVALAAAMLITLFIPPATILWVVAVAIMLLAFVLIGLLQSSDELRNAIEQVGRLAVRRR